MSCLKTSELPPFAQGLSSRLPVLDLPMRFALSFGRRWSSDRCPLMAAAMAFFGLLSIFPLMLAAVAILSRAVAGDTALLTGFRTFVAGFFPGAAQQILSEIDAVAVGANPTTLGVVAILTLLWSGRAYFNTLASVLTTIWPDARPRSFWWHQLVAWALFGGVGMLWMLSTAATVILSAMRAIAVQWPDFFWNRTPLLWLVLARVISWLLTFFMFLLLYRFLPNVQTQRRKRVVWGAAVLGSLSWEGGKWLFANVVGHNVTRYQATYGSVATVVITMLWIYLSSLILLVGAEAAAVYEEICPAN